MSAVVCCFTPESAEQLGQFWMASAPSHGWAKPCSCSAVTAGCCIAPPCTRSCTNPGGTQGGHGYSSTI